MKFMRQLNITFAVILMTMGCSAPRSENAGIRGLSASTNGGNVALLMETNFEYSIPDTNNLKAVLSDPTGNYGFSDITVKQNTMVNDLMNSVTTAAGKVGSDGTLFIYIGGHGSPNGYLQTFDNQFVEFASVQKAIVKGRTSQFRRLVVVIFSCYAGTWIDKANTTLNKLSTQTTNTTVNGLLNSDGSAALPYKELLVITSSGSENQSYGSDLNSGTFFGQAIKKSFAANKGKSGYKMRDFLDSVVKLGSTQINEYTVPQYKVVPASILDENLINDGNAVPTTPSTPIATSLYASLLDQLGSDNSGFQVAADITINSVKICLATAESCKSGTAAAVPMNNSATVIAGKKVFDSAGSYSLNDVMNSGVTFLGYDAANVLISSQQIRAKKLN